MNYSNPAAPGGGDSGPPGQNLLGICLALLAAVLGTPYLFGYVGPWVERVASLPVIKGRPLRTPDELLGMPHDRQVIYTDGLSHPLWAERHAYYDQPSMAGRYHPNPHHPPLDRVRVRTPHGTAWRPVIVEPVPRRFAHFPQYAGGLWSRIG